MDNFKAVYLILSQLERDMDNPRADLSTVNASALCVSENRWLRYIEMMADAGYVKGVRIVQDILGKRCDCRDIEITLKGLEYLQENSIMRKIYNTIRGVTELIP